MVVAPGRFSALLLMAVGILRATSGNALISGRSGSRLVQGNYATRCRNWNKELNGVDAFNQAGSGSSLFASFCRQGVKS
ncbi:hypothetical protein ES703_47169 [subsurface metagenome]